VRVCFKCKTIPSLKPIESIFFENLARIGVMDFGQKIEACRCQATAALKILAMNELNIVNFEAEKISNLVWCISTLPIRNTHIDTELLWEVPSSGWICAFM
jgi:hypothetical protein